MSWKIGQKVCIPNEEFDFAIVRKVLGGEYAGYVDCEIHYFDGDEDEEGERVGTGLLRADLLFDYEDCLRQINDLLDFGRSISANRP